MVCNIAFSLFSANSLPFYSFSLSLQKVEKRGMANAKMYTFLEHSFGRINLKHKLTFGIIYFLKM